MRQIALAIFLFSTLGCKQLILLKEGVKQPVLEDHNSLKKFLAKNQIDTTEILCFQDTVALHQFYKTKIGLPDSRFFNRQRALVDYRESPKDCNGKVSVFLEKIDSMNLRPPIPGELLHTYLQGVVYEKDLSPFAVTGELYDTYLVIYWAKYLGKLNKRKVFEWMTLANDARKRGVKIRVLLINADYQRQWKIKKEDIPYFKY